MLEFTYKGANAVIVSTKKAKIVADPNLAALGLKNLDVDGVVQIATENRFAITSDKAKLTIDSPGEYEVADFTIKGIAAQRSIDNDTESNGTMYRLEANDISVGVIGNIAPKLSEDQQEDLGVLDVLIIPIGGGGYTLDAVNAATIVRQVEPKVVIPIHYADSGIKYEVPQDALDLFTTELSAPVEHVDSLKLKSASTLPASLTTIVLARS